LRFKETVLGSTGLGCLFLHDCILYHIIPYQRCVSRHSGAQQNSLYTIALFFRLAGTCQPFCFHFSRFGAGGRERVSYTPLFL
jgi:hypothetical protein